MQPPNEVFFTLVGEAGSNIVERAAVPLSARSESAIAAAAHCRRDADDRSSART